jgi:hypothetical protein
MRNLIRVLTCPTALTFLLTLFALGGCGGGGGGGSSPTATGTLGVQLTDAPSCGYDHVFVTVNQVRVHSSPTAAATDAGWYDLPVTAPARIDLVNLTNGVLRDLGTTMLPAGTYQQLRLVLAANPNGNSGTLNESIVLTGGNGSEIPLTTPSAVQSGIKLINSFTVAANTLSDVVLDFNACKSIVKAGNSGQYILKPVITVTPVVVSGIIDGWVDPAVASVKPVTVSAQVVDPITGVVTTVKSTVANPATGKFVLGPVLESSMEPSPYNVVISTDGYSNTVLSGVSVAAAATVDLSTSATAIGLGSASAMGTIGGTISVAGIPPGGATPIDATVQALQTVATGVSIEAGSATADPASGSYSLSLPVAAARYAPFVGGSVPSFAVGSNAGKFNLNANATLASGAAAPTKTIINVDISTTAATQNFAF